MNRLMPEEEARIRIEANSMIYRGDHDAAFEYKADILKLLAELDAVRADVLRKDRTIIALNEGYKTLRDDLEPKLADITANRNQLAEENARLRARLDDALKSRDLFMADMEKSEGRLSRAIAALQGIAWSAGSSGNTGHIMLPTIKRRADEVLKELEG